VILTLAIAMLGEGLPLPIRNAFYWSMFGVLGAMFLIAGLICAGLGAKSGTGLMPSPLSVFGELVSDRLLQNVYDGRFRKLLLILLSFVLFCMIMCGLAGSADPNELKIGPVLLAAVGAGLVGAVAGFLIGGAITVADDEATSNEEPKSKQ
jgi:MFS family permease